MTEQDQRIALCEWMGWKRNVIYDTKSRGILSWVNPSGHLVFANLPDTNSLDVLHEMEMKLPDELRNQYATYLAYRGLQKWHYDFHTIHATAAQRREALLRTLGLWKEEEVP